MRNHPCDWMSTITAICEKWQLGCAKPCQAPNRAMPGGNYALAPLQGSAGQPQAGLGTPGGMTTSQGGHFCRGTCPWGAPRSANG